MSITVKDCIPLSVLNDLKCDYCHKFVSCAPVYVQSNGAVCCGRCPLIPRNTQQHRNIAFEALAQIFRFYCCNWEKHCSRSLEWNESLHHEDKCAYSTCCSRFWRRGLCCVGRRELPIGDIRHAQVPPNFLDYIKCIQCQGYLNCEPVFIVPAGNVCHRCTTANGPPPTGIRNQHYELLSRILIFPCIFRSRGCPTKLKFGGDLWTHESICSYNMAYERQLPEVKQPEVTKKTYQKERGVIKTHSGHYYGTLTPNSMLFSPPNPKQDFEINKQIVKSLKKHQERRMVTADQIESQMAEKYSTDSYDDDKMSSETSSSSKNEEDLERRIHNWQNQNSSVPVNRDSGYYTNYRPKSEANPQQIVSSNPQSNSNAPNIMHIPRPDYNRVDSVPTSRTMSSTRQSPELQATHPDPLAYNPSFRAVSRSESVKSNQEVIKELKGKLSKKASTRNDTESPYGKCKNLDDIVVVHERLGF